MLKVDSFVSFSSGLRVNFLCLWIIEAAKLIVVAMIANRMYKYLLVGKIICSFTFRNSFYPEQSLNYLCITYGIYFKCSLGTPSFILLCEVGS